MTDIETQISNAWIATIRRNPGIISKWLHPSTDDYERGKLWRHLIDEIEQQFPGCRSDIVVQGFVAGCGLKGISWEEMMRIWRFAGKIASTGKSTITEEEIEQLGEEFAFEENYRLN
jgi:hypothetical protein